MDAITSLSALNAELKNVDCCIASARRDNRKSGMGACCFNREEMCELYSKRKHILDDVRKIMNQYGLAEVL